MSRAPLEIRDTCPTHVCFATNGAFTWINEQQLDGTRGTIRRFGVAYVNNNALDEADVVALHNAIRQAREKKRAS